MGPKYHVVEHIALARHALGDSKGAIWELEHAGATRAEAVTSRLLDKFSAAEVTFSVALPNAHP
jgi:hypothetical protein